MLNKYFESIKSSKPFKRFDLIIYFFIILSITLLFLFCVILPKRKNISGFKVIISDETVLSYVFNEEIIVSDNYSNNIEITEKENETYIKIFTDNDKKDYNILCVDLEKKEVKITEANCSLSHDCTLFPPLKSGGSIICLPHNLEVVSLESAFSDPVVGG